MEKKQKNYLLFISLFLLLLLLFGGLLGYGLYRFRRLCYRSLDGESHGFYIYPHTSADSALALLSEHYTECSPLIRRLTFRHYELDTVRPGYYRLPSEFGAQTLGLRWRYGRQDPVSVTFNSTVRTRAQLANRLARQLMLDSASIACRLDSVAYMQQYGLSRETAVCLFLPDTYEFYWTVTPDELFERMAREYRAFWTEERRQKARARGLSEAEISTMASIVQSETNRKEEWPQIAGLYLRRLEIGMRLQADPTVVFACQDFAIRRVTARHLATDSPYNTYLYRGLPPGPIRLSARAGIDAVLDAPPSEALYMCANPDFSGNHIFSKSYAQHAAVARQYRLALNRRKIR